jgi:hypothetical protein
VKAFTLVIGALIGIAVSAVVLSFQLALSPYFGFLVLVGVGFWLNDVRQSPQGTSGPNWRSFFTGSAVWIGLGIAALLYRNWLASVPANAVSPSAMGAALLVFGIAFVAVGVYAFRASPSQRVIERWDQLDGPMPIFGMFTASLPLGFAIAFFGAALIFNRPDVFGRLLPMVFPLIVAGVLLLIWQPRQLKPPWLRRYQDDVKKRKLTDPFS